jgi:S-formylglutathione hydrolase FrmB
MMVCQSGRWTSHNNRIMRAFATRRLIPLLVAACLPALPAIVAGRAPEQAAQARPALPVNVREYTIRSGALGRTLPYRVILPAGYETSTARYPVLYLLHGHGGHYGNWTDRTKIVAAAAALPILIVMPEGEDSWYTNGENGEKWETYLVNDLVTYVESKFRAMGTRGGRAIAGLSMGGYGSIKAGLKFPSTFSFAGSLSGAFDITREHDVFTTASHVDVTPIFGKPGSAVRRENDVYALVAHADPKTTPYFYLVEGTSDPWLEPNRELARALSAAKIPYEYHETPGTHDWTFWDREVGTILAKVMQLRNGAMTQ